MGYVILALLFAVWFFTLWLEGYLKRRHNFAYLIYLFDLRDFAVLALSFLAADYFWLNKLSEWQYYVGNAFLLSFATAAIRRVFLK